MIQPLELLDQWQHSEPLPTVAGAAQRLAGLQVWAAAPLDSASTATLPGCLAGEVWRVAAGKLELVAPAGAQAGNRPALVDQSPDGLSAEWEPVHPVQGASRAERATASSSPPIVVIDDDGCIRARVPRSCHRPTPAQLPGPPGFRVLLGGSWPSWATSDSVSSSLTVWKRCPKFRGRDSTSSS